jgi:hypothetical protein
MRRYSTYGISTAIVFITFLTINVFTPQWPCQDCFNPHGVPFAYHHDGGFAGGAAWVWTGMLKDAGLVVGLGVIFGFVCSKLGKQMSSQ